MTVNINVDGINEAFPVPGIDNSSQGFRDNFSVTKANFSVIKTEIEDIKDNSARLDQTNNFLNNKIVEAVFSNTTEEAVVLGGSGTQPGDDAIEIRWTEGSVHVIPVDTLEEEKQEELSLTPLTINLIGWPTTDKLFAKMTFIITRKNDMLVPADPPPGPGENPFKDAMNREVIFAVPDKVLLIDEASFGGVRTLSAGINKTYVVEAFTLDAGETVYLRKIGEFE